MGEATEAEIRVDLAAAFRIAAKLDWHESVANHFSAAISDDGATFLMNPRWRQFELIRASELLELRAGDASVMERPDAPDPSAWCIHGAIHAEVPAARVLLHCHPPYATTLASLADPTIKPIDQTTARYHDRVAYDLNFGGLADDEAEGKRLAGVIADHPVLMMGNHGVMVVGETIARAFDELFYFERACENYIIALTTGKTLRVASDAVAEKTAEQWDDYVTRVGISAAHLREIREILDREEPDYKT